jgi:hypothetical protein
MIEIQLTPAEFAAKAKELAEKHDIKLDGNAGQLSKMGVTAAYAYQDGLLTVNILNKPFFVTAEYCEDQLKTFFGLTS